MVSRVAILSSLWTICFTTSALAANVVGTAQLALGGNPATITVTLDDTVGVPTMGFWGVLALLAVVSTMLLRERKRVAAGILALMLASPAMAAVVQVMRPAANGVYSFTGLADGPYRLVFEAPGHETQVRLFRMSGVDIILDEVVLPVISGTPGVFSGSIATSNPANANLIYDGYAPASNPGEIFRVLVPVSGLDGRGRGFTRNEWQQFADQERMVIVSPWFRFDLDDWNNFSSYQYPSAWSGQALEDILDNVALTQPIDTERVYLFGFSAGAQFVHRYGLVSPERCVALAAHAAGGYTNPTAFVDVAYSIAVGDLDTVRVPGAQSFHNAAAGLGIDSRLTIYPGLGHSLTQTQIQNAFSFFRLYP